MKIFLSVLLFLPILIMAQDHSRAVTPFFIMRMNYQAETDYSKDCYAIDKMIVGVSYKINSHWLAKVGIDYYNHTLTDDEKIHPFWKPFQLQYHKNKLTIDAGVFSTSQWDTQFKLWNKRYLLKTIQNKYGFAFFVDAGVRVKFQLTDWWTTDVSAFNGDGYKSLEMNDQPKLAFNNVFEPIDNVLFKFYIDGHTKNITQYTQNFFMHYQVNRTSFSFEYADKTNADFIKSQRFSAFSLAGTRQLNPKMEFFIRYDSVSSNRENYVQVSDSRLGDNGSGFMTGIDYKIYNSVRIGLNWQYWHYTESDFGNDSFIFLAMETLIK